jgi:hypothetical protein
MSEYYGDHSEDQTVYIPFSTFEATGGSVTISDLVTTDVFVYKNGVVLADPDAGVTVTIDAGTGDGAHLVIIDTSADAQYVTGADYQVKFEGATIDGETVNPFIGCFSIENRHQRGTNSALLAASVTISDGAIESDMTHIHGTALTETAGLLAGGFKKFFNVAAPTGTLLSLPDAVPDDPGGLLITIDGSLDMDRIIELLEGDEELDYAQTPARRIIFLKGTGTEILKKQLKQIDGITNITAVTQTIGKSEDEAV